MPVIGGVLYSVKSQPAQQIWSLIDTAGLNPADSSRYLNKGYGLLLDPDIQAQIEPGDLQSLAAKLGITLPKVASQFTITTTVSDFQSSVDTFNQETTDFLTGVGEGTDPIAMFEEVTRLKTNLIQTNTDLRTAESEYVSAPTVAPTAETGLTTSQYQTDEQTWYGSLSTQINTALNNNDLASATSLLDELITGLNNRGVTVPQELTDLRADVGQGVARGEPVYVAPQELKTQFQEGTITQAEYEAAQQYAAIPFWKKTLSAFGQVDTYWNAYIYSLVTGRAFTGGDLLAHYETRPIVSITLGLRLWPTGKPVITVMETDLVSLGLSLTDPLYYLPIPGAGLLKKVAGAVAEKVKPIAWRLRLTARTVETAEVVGSNVLKKTTPETAEAVSAALRDEGFATIEVVPKAEIPKAGKIIPEKVTPVTPEIMIPVGDETRFLNIKRMISEGKQVSREDLQFYKDYVDKAQQLKRVAETDAGIRKELEKKIATSSLRPDDIKLLDRYPDLKAKLYGTAIPKAEAVPTITDEVIANLGGIEGTKAKIAELEKSLSSPRVSPQKKIDNQIHLSQLKERLEKVEAVTVAPELLGGEIDYAKVMGSPYAFRITHTIPKLPTVEGIEKIMTEAQRMWSVRGLRTLRGLPSIPGVLGRVLSWPIKMGRPSAFFKELPTGVWKLEDFATLAEHAVSNRRMMTETMEPYITVIESGWTKIVGTDSEAVSKYFGVSKESGWKVTKYITPKKPGESMVMGDIVRYPMKYNFATAEAKEVVLNLQAGQTAAYAFAEQYGYKLAIKKGNKWVSIKKPYPPGAAHFPAVYIEKTLPTGEVVVRDFIRPHPTRPRYYGLEEEAVAAGLRPMDAGDVVKLHWRYFFEDTSQRKVGEWAEKLIGKDLSRQMLSRHPDIAHVRDTMDVLWKRAENQRGNLSKMRAGWIPTEQTLKAIGRIEPDVQAMLEKAMRLQPEQFTKALDNFTADVWKYLGTDRETFIRTIGTEGLITTERLREAIKILVISEEKSLRTVRQIYRNAYQFATREQKTLIKEAITRFDKKMAELKPKVFEARKIYSQAAERLKYPAFEEGGVVNWGYFRGKYVPREFAKQLAKHRLETNQWLEWASKPAGALRTLETGPDISYPAIQGLPTAFSRPDAWAKATLRSIQAGLDPRSHSAQLLRHWDTALTIANNRGQLAGIEFFELYPGMERFLGKYKVTRPVRRLFSETYGRSNAMWGSASDNMAIYLTEAWRPFIVEGKGSWWGALEHPETFIRRKLGWNFGTAVQRERWLQEHINLMRGLTTTAGLGVGPNQAAFETTLGWFARRYTASGVGLSLNVLRGGVTGALARETLGKFMIGGMILYVGALERLGYDWDEILDRITPTSSRFLTLRIGNRNVGIAGIWYGLARLAGNIAETIADGEIMNFAKLDRFDNPLVNFWFNRTSALTSAVLLGFGLPPVEGGPQEYMGQPLEDWTDYLEFIGTKALPFWVESVITEANMSVLGALAEFTGARTVAVPWYQQRNELRDQLALELTNGQWTWKDLLPSQKATLLAGDSELRRLTDLAIADSTSWDDLDFAGRDKERADALAEHEANLQIITDAFIQCFATNGENCGTILREGTDGAGGLKGENNRYYTVLDNIDSRYPEIMEFYAQYAPETTNPVVVALDDWYETMSDPRLDTPTGYDYELRDQLEQAFKEKWGDDIYNQVQEELKLRRMTDNPVLNELNKAKDILQPYWDIEDNIKANAEAQGQVPDAAAETKIADTQAVDWLEAHGQGTDATKYETVRSNMAAGQPSPNTAFNTLANTYSQAMYGVNWDQIDNMFLDMEGPKPGYVRDYSAETAVGNQKAIDWLRTEGRGEDADKFAAIVFSSDPTPSDIVGDLRDELSQAAYGVKWGDIESLFRDANLHPLPGYVEDYTVETAKANEESIQWLEDQGRPEDAEKLAAVFASDEPDPSEVAGTLRNQYSQTAYGKNWDDLEERYRDANWEPLAGYVEDSDAEKAIGEQRTLDWLKSPEAAKKKIWPEDVTYYEAVVAGTKPDPLKTETKLEKQYAQQEYQKEWDELSSGAQKDLIFRHADLKEAEDNATIWRKMRSETSSIRTATEKELITVAEAVKADRDALTKANPDLKAAETEATWYSQVMSDTAHFREFAHEGLTTIGEAVEADRKALRTANPDLVTAETEADWYSDVMADTTSFREDAHNQLITVEEAIEAVRTGILEAHPDLLTAKQEATWYNRVSGQVQLIYEQVEAQITTVDESITAAQDEWRNQNPEGDYYLWLFYDRATEGQYQVPQW